MKNHLDIRSFSNILVKHQGGHKLKPGQPVVVEASAAEVEKCFGHIPVAVAAHDVTIMIENIGGNRYRMTIKLNV